MKEQESNQGRGVDAARGLKHRAQLEHDHVPHTFRQELDGAWTLRFGPLSPANVATALSAFVY
jgi:hypothetical protein